MAEAWTYAWQHWERIEQMENPAGYVYRIGRTRASRLRPRSHVRLPHVTAIEMPWIEPELPEALSRLSERQRVAVVLVHCFEYTHAEAAEVLGVSRPSLQKHVERGMGKLRRTLGVNQ
jgi:RNA polymerase sigma factor (sigma-70 family)